MSVIGFGGSRRTSRGVCSTNPDAIPDMALKYVYQIDRMGFRHSSTEVKGRNRKNHIDVRERLAGRSITLLSEPSPLETTGTEGSCCHTPSTTNLYSYRFGLSSSSATNSRSPTFSRETVDHPLKLPATATVVASPVHRNVNVFRSLAGG